MYILGISGHKRNAAAALLRDGIPVFAIEEEKLARNKTLDYRQSGGLPLEAIGYCLHEAGIGIEDVDVVACDFRPLRVLNRQHQFSRNFVEPASDPADYQAASLNEYHARMSTLAMIKRLIGSRGKSRPVDHQLAHAAASFYSSGFERAAILVLSGKGDYVSLAIGTGEGNKVNLHTRIDFPQSLGWLYSQVTGYLGYSSGGEYQTQWLSTIGEPEFLSSFEDMIRIDRQGMPKIDLSYFDLTDHQSDGLSEKFFSTFGDHLRDKNGRLKNGDSSHHQMGDPPQFAGLRDFRETHGCYRRNIARSLQLRLEETVLALIERIRKDQKIDALCLGGGVASNSLLISRIESEGGFQRIFTPPAAGNSGNSLGSAMFVYHNQLGLGRPEPLENVFLGPDYPDLAVKPVFDNCKLRYRYLPTEEKLTDDVVEMLIDGAIVAWFQGRAEFGPRSLGARSILANPMRNYTNENLNVYLKHREPWRPFAVSVPEDRADEFFENVGSLNRFLLTVSRIRDDKRTLLPAAWFSDGLARVHLVERRHNPLYWRLLTKFGEKTGVPILVNTSFNLFGEPIICTPRDAVRSFYCSGIDALVINRFLIVK